MPETGPQYPSKRQMLRNLALSAAQAASDPRPAPRTLKEKRLEICNLCEWFDGQQLRCKACGCYLVAKAAITGSKCPKGKWEEALGSQQDLPPSGASCCGTRQG